MSVQTELDRIVSAVDAAHTKVAEKGGTTARPYLVGNLEAAIDSIPAAADPKLQTKTVTPTTSAQNVTPDSGYDGLSKVTVNAMPTATQATPSITVSSAGLITAKSTQSAGYVASGTKQATKQLTTQAAQTITPGTSNKTIASGRYLTGTQTIKGDANLKAENIKSGVSIFGVSGSYQGSGGSSGGGCGVKTCNITFDWRGGNMYQVNAIVLNGDTTKLEQVGYYTGNPLTSPITFENVVCGSSLIWYTYISAPGFTVTDATFSDFASLASGCYMLTFDAEDGADASISVYSNA